MLTLPQSRSRPTQDHDLNKLGRAEVRLMLYTKFEGYQSAGFEENFKGFYHIWAWLPPWSHDQDLE